MRLPSVAALTFMLAYCASAQMVTKSFDGFTGRTRFTLASTKSETIQGEHGVLIGAGGVGVGKVDLTGSFDCAGKVLMCTPKSVNLLFVASTSDWQFSKLRTIRLLVDGARFDLGEYRWDGKVFQGDELIEFMNFSISPQLLKKLATAHRIEVQLSTFEFLLSAENLAALRGLANFTR